MGSAVAFGVQAGKSIYDLFDSIHKNREANKIYRTTKRPVYNRPGEIDDVYNTAASEINNTAASDGMERQASQGLSDGIDAVLKSGNGADFNTIYNNYGKNLNNALAIQNQQRAQRIASYNNAAYNFGKAKDTEFQFNKVAPYMDAMQRAALLKEQGAKALADSFTNVAGAASNFALSQEKPGKYGKTTDTRTPDQVLGEGQSPVTNIQRDFIPFTPEKNIAAPQEISFEQDPMAWWNNYSQTPYGE